MNKVIIMGRLGRDPSFRTTATGSACYFSLATHERERREEGWIEHTEWHHVVTFGKLSELVNEYLGKGEQALVEGKLRTRRWVADGVERVRTEIVASSVQFLGGRKEVSDV
jgi:single-strand DNA-binding protein